MSAFELTDRLPLHERAGPAGLLQARGLIAPGERTEELVVIRAIKPSQV